jgi:oxygen-independent coproporphyrinogen-3 oxidase
VKSVYIHVPFCFHKCHYCDFYSISGSEVYHEEFVHRLTKEVEFVGNYLDTIDTIFIGGGTPTLFEQPLFEEMLCQIASHIPLGEEYEWTIEANPETVTQAKAMSMAKHGVNRVSIGAQSFHPDLLQRLERWHEPENVERAVNCIRQVGIQDINLDLMYAIPSQTEEQLLLDLQKAIAFEPTHLSCYALTYEPNTPLHTRLAKGQVQRVSQDVETSMFKKVHEVLESSGYEQYEISNYAKDSYVCKHNIAYWTNQSWWPFGPSASGHVDGRRWKNTPRINDYLNQSPLPLVVDVEQLDADQSAGEAFMLGLRMVKGMQRTWVENLIAQSNNAWRASVIEGHIEGGLLHWLDNCLALTPDGMLIADTVMISLLMQDEKNTDTKERTTP